LVKKNPEGNKNIGKRKKATPNLEPTELANPTPTQKKTKTPGSRTQPPKSESLMAPGVTVIWGTEQPMFDQVETLWEIVCNPNKITSFYSSPQRKNAKIYMESDWAENSFFSYSNK